MELINYTYQGEAEDALFEKISQALESDEKRTRDNAILFAAPVAAGKTKMSAMVADRIGEEYPDVAVFFIAPSDGQLHNQAYKGFKKYGLSHLTVRNLATLVSEDGSSGKVKPRTLNVIGWSDIISRKKNTQRQIGETPTLQSLLTKNKGKTKIVLFIDEAHSNATKNTDDIIKLISPWAVVNITATPHMKEKDKALANLTFVEVDPKAVAEEGKIKQTITVNDAGRDDGAELVFDEKGLIKLGMKRRDLMDKEAAKVGLHCTHLMVVQVLNDDNYDKKDTADTVKHADEAKMILKKLGATDDEIITWLAGEQTIDPLKIKDTDHKYVITKLAISKGWDCPRAAVLVKLRFTSKSDTLDEQTLGRIMRTTDVKAWQKNEAYRENEMLNTAFIYTADEDYDATLNSYTIKSEKYKQVIRDEHKNYWKDVHLVAIKPGAKTYTGKNKIIKKQLTDAFNEKFPYDHDGAQWVSISGKRKVAQYSVETEKFYGEIAEKGKLATEDHTRVEMKADEIERFFYARVRRTASLKRHKDWIQYAIEQHVADNLYDGERDDFERPTDIKLLNEKTNEFLLAAWDNYDDFEDTVVSIFDKNAEFGKSTVMDGEDGRLIWSIPSVVYNGVGLVKREYDNFAFDKMTKLDEKYSPEVKFAKEIMSKYMTSWFKNGTLEPDSFCIDWTDDDGIPRKFFPDFFGIKDNVLYILETKGGYDEEGDHAIAPDKDKNKAKAIRKWLKSKHMKKSLDKSPGVDYIVFGICRKFFDDWKIYVGDGNDYDDRSSDGWKPLINIIKHAAKLNGDKDGEE